MILRASRKPAAPARNKISVEDVRKLQPFHSLHESLLQSVVANSHLLRPKSGTWTPDDPEGQLYFLRRGSLRFTADRQSQRQLTYDTPGACFPIPADGQWTIQVAPDTEILAIPARYLELDHSQHTSERSLEFQKDDIGGEIYLQFYEALKNDNYELPSLPDLAVRIGKAIDDPNTLNDDIARLIQMDPALATRVMSVVNSAAYGGVEPIRTLQQAVARLGRQQVRNLVFSCIIKGLFRTDSPVLKKSMKTLWSHSSRVAAISFVLARVTPGMDPNRALLAGLVHDIGAIPILQMARDNPQASSDPQLLGQLVDNLKAEIGSLTLGAWNFDPEMVALARDAEHWFRIGSAVPDYLDVVLLAQLHAYVGDTTKKDLPRIDQVPAFRKLALGQLTPRHSIGILEHAAKDIEEVERLLNVA